MASSNLVDLSTSPRSLFDLTDLLPTDFDPEVADYLVDGLADLLEPVEAPTSPLEAPLGP